MDYLQALILSVVEGTSEFLPISSTGHLVLASQLLGVPQTEFVKSFEIIIQLGAVLAVVALYWRTFFEEFGAWKKVIAAFIPTSIVGLVLYKYIKQVLLGNDAVTLWALALGGVVLIAIELWHKEKDGDLSSIDKVSYKQAVLIGLAQSISVIPGVSRAAATIVGGLVLGLKREIAVKFSFLLAIPTMLAATGLDLIKTPVQFTNDEWSVLAVGFVGSFVVALIVVKFFLDYIKHHTFIPFGIYRIVAAFLFWLLIIN